jgi:hypothetical protein
MESRRIKDYLVYYIPQRVIIFPINEYQEVIIDNIIKNFLEWGLLYNKVISCKEKYFKYFLEKEIDSILDSFRMMFSDLNVKILTVYKNIEVGDSYKHWFEDHSQFNKVLVKTLKKKTKYFKEAKKDNLLFINTEGKFKGIKLGVPTGEETEFLQKTLAKSNTPNN